MKNKKGFTLIELLAVIVILGVILGIAIPKVSQYITNSKKDSFASAGKLFVESVRNDSTSEEYPFPINRNDVVIVTLDQANMEKSKKKSAFGGKYLYNKSYVIVTNVGDGTYPDYVYYFAAQDSKGYAIPLTVEGDLDKTKVIANAKNKMEVTIQSFCGSREGTETILPSISGLESVQPTDPETGEKLDWHAMIYSTEECGTDVE